MCRAISKVWIGIAGRYIQSGRSKTPRAEMMRQLPPLQLPEAVPSSPRTSWDKANKGKYNTQIQGCIQTLLRVELQVEVTSNLPTIPSRAVQRLVDPGSKRKGTAVGKVQSPKGSNPGVQLHGTPGGETPGVSLGPWVVGQRLKSPL